MKELKRKPCLCLNGSAFNRGLIHGTTLKKEISELVVLWKTQLKQDRSVQPDQFIDDFLDETNYISAIEQYTPDLLEEVKGIAEGSEINLRSLIAFQLLDELLLNRAGINDDHCSMEFLAQ